MTLPFINQDTQVHIAADPVAKLEATPFPSIPDRAAAKRT